MSEFMEQSQNSAASDSDRPVDGGQEPTIFEQVMDIQIRLHKSAGVPAEHLPPPSSRELPKWSSKILEQFCKTILKPILKLKPKGVMNWRNYGRLIGIMERYNTFLSHDMERMWKEEGLDKTTDEQWERLRPKLGEDKCRQHLIKILNRPVADDESLEKLIIEALERQLEHLEKLKQIASFHVAQQDPKTTNLFFKGMAEGYTCFLDENGGLSGDRGRTNIYMDFLAYHLEIEKYRRTMPVKSRRDLQAWVINEAKIRIPNDDDWFDHFCDEICLSMKGVGRKPNPQTS